MSNRLTIAMVSIGIRRDLLAPLGYFQEFELVHLYKNSVYGDMTPTDWDATLRPYSSPHDLYRQLVAARPAVIQGVEPFSYYTQPYLWACFLAARKTRSALLVATHENLPLDAKFGQARAAILRRTLKSYFARACLIITHNNGGKANVLSCGAAPQKIVRGMWGNWGVDTREFYPAPDRSSLQVPTILFAGRLHEEKGVFVLLDAIAQVIAACPGARLSYVGDGPARAQLEAQIQARGLSDSVRLVGIVKHREMPETMRQADIFCAPSVTTQRWAEQVGASALQALATGIPVVSTHSGAIPEYIPDGQAGILVEERDQNALAAALIELMNDPARAREMGQRGREYACAHYDAKRNVERGEQLVMEYCVANRV